MGAYFFDTSALVKRYVTFVVYIDCVPMMLYN
jgi:hypothetical protein